MKTIMMAFLAVVGLTGCQTSQKRGTELATDQNGRTQMTTYISPEEYERMTPEERNRQHVAVGVQASTTWGGASAPKGDVSSAALDKALANASK